MLRMVEKGCLLRMVDGGNLGSDLSTDKEHSGWASLSWDICTSNRKNIRSSPSKNRWSYSWDNQAKFKVTIV